MLDTRFYKAKGPIALSELIYGLDIEFPHEKFSDELISCGAMLSVSKPKHICYLENKREKSQADTARATACFVTKGLADVIGNKHIIPLVTNTPRAHFARVLARLVSPLSLQMTSGKARVSKSAIVHDTAILGAGAVIAAGVIISPYVVIGPGVHIGARSFIGSHTHIECAILGEDCKIKSHAVIGGAGFGVTADEHGLIDILHIGRVIIGDRVSIGSQSCVDRGLLEDTELGDDVKIDNLVQIGHNVVVGAGTVMAGHVGISGSCLIGKRVKLGGAVGLSDHISVGDGASIAARSGVMHDIPAGETWSGVPAMPIRDHMRLVSATRKISKRPKK